MAQPVKLSDALVLDARLAAEPLQRSIAGQVEFWARLGRSVDLLLEGRQVLQITQNKTIKPLSECLAPVGTAEGAKKIAHYINRRPKPHFEAVIGSPGLFDRIAEDGTKVTGRLSGRKFIPIDSSISVAKKR